MRVARFQFRPTLAVAGVAVLYTATVAALGLVALFAVAAGLAATPRVRLESLALVAIIAAAAILAGSAVWPAARKPAAQVFRYIIWVPILIGGPTGLAILGTWWSIVTLFLMPRARGFSPAGLRLEPERHPRLARLVAEAAQDAGAASVTLYLDLSATVEAGTVRHRGTAVVLGLYALALLEPAQLRALLTREFALAGGGGMPRLAYRMHERCFRLLGRPRQLDFGAYLFFPRLALGMRYTQAAARAHEAGADARAAQAAGEAALESGRLQLAVAAAVQGAYHQQALAPVLMLGHRPGLVEGLRHWLASPEAAATIAAAVEGASSPNDGRGPQRGFPGPAVTAPGRYAARPAYAFQLPAESSAALACTDSPWLLEEQLLQAMGVRLKPVAWEGVARELYLHNWEQVLSEHGDSLRGWTPRRVPELCRDLDGFGRRLLKDEAAKFMPAYRARMAETVLGISLAMCVQRAGWNVYDLPGQPLWLERRQQRIEPFALVAGLQAGKTSPEAFLEQCAQAGILDCDLSGATP